MLALNPVSAGIAYLGIMEQNNLSLGIPGFNYADLYDPARLKDLLDAFDVSVKKHDADLFNRYADYRQSQGEGLTPESLSELLVQMALCRAICGDVV